MYLPPRIQTLQVLPCDILGVIAHQWAILCLRDHTRAWLHRHARRRLWPTLRRLVVPRCSSAELALMQGCAWIRREWRIEPTSWLYMLHHEPMQLRLIIVEIVSHRLVRSAIDRLLTC